QSFMMHLEKAEAVEVVKELCQKSKWRALDTDTGQFIDNQAQAWSSINKDKNSSKSWWKLWKK
ncbi:MAG: hypothetical protein K0Q65_2564, partial [Clostridia bacterium]|nr:hypothetical protein [Clostridia bacterium]